jgi:hypothetical protein
LGGAALQRCGKGFALNPASAAEVMLTASERVFPQPLQPCRQVFANLSALQRLRLLLPRLDDFFRDLF